MKTETIPFPCTRPADFYRENVLWHTAHTYSLVQTAHLLGLSFASLHELIVRHELHTETGPRGSRVSRLRVLDYATRRQSIMKTGMNFVAPLGSTRGTRS
jgi:hypothetical protein